MKDPLRPRRPAPIQSMDFAFPIVTNEDTTMFGMGLTIRDYFAMRAPRDIPSWFMTEPIEPYKGPERPTIPADASEEDRQTLDSWQRDACFDLPPHLAWFASQTDAAVEGRKAHQADYQTDRYFQWPYAWAESMLATRDAWTYADDGDDTPATSHTSAPVVPPIHDGEAEHQRRVAIATAPEGTEFTLLWRNKFLCTDTDNIEEFAAALHESAAQVDHLRQLGVTLRDDGGVGDDYATLVTTDKTVALAEGFVVEPDMGDE